MANKGQAVRREPSERAKVGVSLSSFLFAIHDLDDAMAAAVDIVPSLRLAARALPFLVTNGDGVEVDDVVGGTVTSFSDLERSCSSTAAERGPGVRPEKRPGLLGDSADGPFIPDGSTRTGGDSGKGSGNTDGSVLSAAPSDASAAEADMEKRRGEMLKLATLLLMLFTYCCSVLKKLMLVPVLCSVMYL